MNELLTDSNYLLYCARHYDNPQCYDIEEFYEDLRRIKYIKKLVTRYIITGELKERLILNHLIILNNVFPPPHLAKILFLKLDKQMKYIKPFLLYMGLLPEILTGIHDDKCRIDSDTIEMDELIIDALRKL
jgi:hypothetical protein